MKKCYCDEARLLLLGHLSPRTRADLLGLLQQKNQQEPRRGALI